MPAILITALLIFAASLAAGWVLLALLGESRPTPLAGAVGFAALTVACPLLTRLPGRATTTAILLLAALVAGAIAVRRRPARAQERARGEFTVALATALVSLALACLPFAFNEHVGVLGEGIYTNDQAAQLYWTDWLQHGFGPEPSAVRFGYPTGPQALTATAAQATGVELDDAFNGLLVAIPVLAALAALGVLRSLPSARRVAVAVLVGLPYLAASFLAQSAFKETVMALLVLAFAVALERGTLASPRARLGTLLILPAAAFFTYSVPGLVWFAGILAVWLALELGMGDVRLPLDEWRAAARAHRRTVAVVGAVAVVVVVLGAIQGSGFVSKIGDVQASTGRLSSPVWPGEALGIWPEGDFRIVRGDVGGAYPATLIGLIVIGAGAWLAWRRRRFALLAALGAAAAVYVGARLFASIYVEAKALAVLAPLVALVALGELLTPSDREQGAVRTARWRLALGALAAVAFAVSTLLALRAAPVGFGGRGAELESLAAKADGQTVVFLGVDRFAGYWLRDTLAESPGGYVPAEVRARPEKIWQQGDPMDLDTLTPSKLDRFDYAITTNAAFQSTPPPNVEEVARTDSFVLWKRTGKTPPQRVLKEDGDPGRVLGCGKAHVAVPLPAVSATVLDDPVAGDPLGWSIPSPFDAPASATQKLDLAPGRWQLSLQYASQVPITVDAGGSSVELPASLDGMYLTHPGENSFWDAGQIEVATRKPTTITVRASEPSALQRALGVERRVWLGHIAATHGTPRDVPIAHACNAYVDHYLPGGRG
jgi:hypothetical protein